MERTAKNAKRSSFDPPGLRPEFSLEERLPEPFPQLVGGYELRGASVVVDGRRALDSLRLSTLPKESVAIVGATGSGKSTLTMVLAKLYGYTGSVLLDRAELEAIPAAVAGRQIAYVAGEARLFTGTVFDNLVYGLRHGRGARDAGNGAGHGVPIEDRSGKLLYQADPPATRVIAAVSPSAIFARSALTGPFSIFDIARKYARKARRTAAAVAARPIQDRGGVLRAQVQAGPT